MKRILSFIFAIVIATAASAQTAKAIWTAGNTTLTFVYDNTTYTPGTSKVGGQTVTNVWTGLNTGTAVPAWIATVKETLTKVTFAASFKNARPTSCAKWFYHCEKLTTITNIANLNTASVTNMSCMFINCKSLISVDISNFNTSNVTDMHDMFCYCEKITTLNFTNNFNTAKVTSMAGMFEYCKSLTTLNLSNNNFNTAKVTNMSGMFNGCSSLTSLNISKFNTANVTNMGKYEGEPSSEVDDSGKTITYNYGGMFQNCSSLTTLSLSSFNTAKVTNMANMFQNCSALTTLTINTTNFNTAKVTDMSYMFYGCSALPSLNVSTFNTAVVTDMQYMFYGCSALTSLNVNGNSFTAAKVTNMGHMFYNCSKLTTLNVSKFNTALVTNMRSMFSVCSALQSITFGANFKTTNVTDMYGMFDSDKSLTSLNLSTFVTSKVTHFTYMFWNCSSLTNIDLSQMNTAAATNYSSMFTSVPAQCFVYMPKGVLDGIKSQRSKNLVLKDGSNWTCANCEMTVEKEYDIWYLFKATSLTVAGSSASAHCLYNNGTVYSIVTTNANVTIPKGTDKFSTTFTGQAVWTAGNYTLTFVGTNKWKKGDTFTGGQTITAVWGGTDVTASANTPAWISNTTYNVKASVTKVVFDTSFQYVKPTKCQNWFSGCTKLTQIEPLSRLNTSSVTTMLGMFNGCSSLTSLNLSSFNTSNVTTTESMFNGCTKLATLTLGNTFTTVNVKSMANMFNGCAALKALDLAWFSTSEVTTMANMFKGCATLTTLNLTSFYTSKVTTMANMFNGCSKLVSIDAINFRSDALTTYTTMFTGMPDLSFVYIPTGMPDGLKSQKAKNLVLRSSNSSSTYTCANCWMKQSTEYNILHGFTATSLTVDGSTSSVHALYCNNSFIRNIHIHTNVSIISGIDKLVPTFPQAIWTSGNKTLTFLLAESLYKSGNTYNGQTINGVWSGNAVAATGTTTPGWVNTVKGALTTVVFDASFKDVHPSSFQNWFSQCEKLTTINMTNVGWSSATTAAYMFNGCKSLETFTFPSSANATNLTTMEGLFKNCTGLKTISYAASGLRTPALTNLKALCSGCTSLTSIRTSGNNNNIIYNTTNVTTMESMFQDCKALTTLNFGSSFSTQNVTNMRALLAGCSKLSSLSMPSSTFTTNNVVDFSSMFADCTSLPNLTLSFNTGSAQDMSFMFAGCSGLTSLTITNFNTAAVKNMSSMFAGCSGLTTLNIANFNTAVATNMSSMFAGCSGLKKLILSNFTTPVATNMSSMFSGCTALETLDISNFSTPKVTAYTDMFKEVPEMSFIYTPAAVRAEIRNMRPKNLVLKDGSGVWTCANCWMTIYKTYEILYDFTATSLTADGSSATTVWLYKDNVATRKITAFANEAIPKGNDKLTEGGAPQVIWTEGNTTLTFLVPGDDLYAVGDNYNGETITKVWAAFNTGDISTPTWLSTVQSTLSNVVFDNSFATYLPESCSNWFYNCTNLTTVTGWENLKTSEVISFYQMFKNDANLQSVDVSGFETSKCIRFQDMFQRCSSLTSIDVTNFNTAKATSLGGMFAYCTGLTELDLSSFETSLVTDFGWLVRGCTNLMSLDISNFNTQRLSTYNVAFENVSDKCFIFIPNGQWTKFNVTKNYNLVYKASNGTFSCSRCWVEHDTNYKIYHDFTATNLTVNGSDATTHYIYCNDVLHSKVDGLKNIAVPKGVDRFWKFGPHAIWTAENNTLTFTASTPLSLGDDFNGRTISKVWEGFDVTANSQWYNDNEITANATTVVFDDEFSRIRPTSCDNWFASFDKLTGFTNWSNLNTSQVTSMNNMFADCSSLTSLDLSTFDTQKVTSMDGMFKGCTGFSYFDLLPLNTENVTSSTGMFEGVDNSVFVYMNSPVANCIATDRSENLVQKLGEDGFTCDNCVLYDAKTLTLPYGFTAMDGVTYMRNIPANTGNAYTVFLPYEREVPEGTKVYTLRTDEQYLREEKKIVFEEVVSGIMEAYKPYLLSNLGSDITDFNTIFDTEVLSSTTMPDKPTIDDLQFTGTIRTIDNAEAAAMGAYIMQVGNKWKKVTTDKTTAYIPAYRAYIVSPTGNIKTWLSELELPDETGIEAIETIDRDGTRTIYDLSGRRLNKTQRGINIVNGRKVVIK